MNSTKSKLEKLTAKQIQNITEKAEHRLDISLIHSKQVNMRLDNSLLTKIKLLASSQKIPFTTFLTRLLKEDIERLWKVYKKIN